MKTLPLLSVLAVFAASVSAVRADYLITISMSSADKSPPKEYVTKMQGDRMRTEMDKGNAVITDRKTGLRMLLHADTKTATDMSDLGKSMSGVTDKDKDKPQPKPVPTGKKETVAGYEAEEFTYNMDEDTKISIWAATNYPKDKAQALMSLYQASSARTFAALPDLSLLPGPIIRSVVKAKDGAIEIDSVIKSVTEAKFDDKEFEVPADYTVKKLPARPAMRKQAK